MRFYSLKYFKFNLLKIRGRTYKTSTTKKKNINGTISVLIISLGIGVLVISIRLVR